MHIRGVQPLETLLNLLKWRLINLLIQSYCKVKNLVVVGLNNVMTAVPSIWVTVKSKGNHTLTIQLSSSMKVSYHQLDVYLNLPCFSANFPSCSGKKGHLHELFQSEIASADDSAHERTESGNGIHVYLTCVFSLNFSPSHRETHGKTHAKWGVTCFKTDETFLSLKHRAKRGPLTCIMGFTQKQKFKFFGSRQEGGAKKHQIRDL